MDQQKSVIKSLGYKYAERMLYQGIAFAIQILLARMLTPDVYGQIGILSVFIIISQVFVQSGFSTALVQNNHVTEEDYSSVLWVGVFVAIGIYAVLYLASPFIASFYGMPDLKNLLRVLALVLLPGAFNSVQNAIVAREMKFRQLVYCTTGAVVVSGGVGVLMASRGMGAWSLVGQQLTYNIVLCILLLCFIRFKIRFAINWKRIRILFSFGWKLLCAHLIEKVYIEIQSLVIGKKYSSADLAFFNRGKQFPQIIVDNLNGSIQSVMLPVFSREQNDTQRLKAIMRRAIVTSSYIIFPLMAGLIVVSEPLVKVLLMDKWVPCVPYLRIFCIVYAFYPIHTANLEAINAQGRSDHYLKLEIIKKTLGLAMLVSALVFFDSPIAIAAGVAIVSIVSCLINSAPNKALLNYSYFEQMKDILPSLLLALVMAAAIYPINLLDLKPAAILVIQIFAGMILYWLMSEIFKPECYLYIKSHAIRVLKKTRT